MGNSEKNGVMVKYIVGQEDPFKPWTLMLIEAETADDAMLKFRKYLLFKDPAFLEDIADKAVNMSFVERFWLSTPKEQEKYRQNGEVIATEADFASRVFNAFGDNRVLARQYIQYQLDSRAPDVKALPEGVPEFIAANLLDDSYLSLFAVPLDDIPVCDNLV